MSMDTDLEEVKRDALAQMPTFAGHSASAWAASMQRAQVAPPAADVDRSFNTGKRLMHPEGLAGGKEGLDR